MKKTQIHPLAFINPASFEPLANRILSDLSFVWETELWLDLLEKAKLAGVKFLKPQEGVVARELLVASGRLNSALSETIGLLQLYDNVGALTAQYDDARAYLEDRSKDGVSFAKIVEDAQPYLGGVLAKLGFPEVLLNSLIEKATELKFPLNEILFLADEKGIHVRGDGKPHTILREAKRQFPRVGGDVFIHQGLLKSYAFSEEKKKTCETDVFQAFLALAKYSQESYQERARIALEKGLVPFKSGVAPIVVAVIIGIAILIIAAVAIGISCASGGAKGGFCDISLKIIGVLITIGLCYLANQKDSPISCNLEDTQGGQG